MVSLIHFDLPISSIFYQTVLRKSMVTAVQILPLGLPSRYSSGGEEGAQKRLDPALRFHHDDVRICDQERLGPGQEPSGVRLIYAVE